jgi:conjugal transfer pilus assembly protein TraI
MSIISGLFLKSGTLWRYDHDIIFDTDDEYDIPHTPIKDVQIYRDYPSKPACITLFSEYAIYPYMQTGYSKSIGISVCQIQT